MQDRCPWCGTDPLYVAYHDTEWGVPCRDPRALWEMLMLEGFQAGLSWITILRKRDTFREAFDGFDPVRIATWGEADTLRLLANPGIIRHRGKIEATYASARAFLAIEARQGFAPFLWSFAGHRPVQSNLAAMTEIKPETPASQALSKALKAEGFKFCGPAICHAFMQASGMVNDHLTSCPRHAEVAAMG